MPALPAPNVTARRVYLETFGCQMNVLDSELVEGQLRALGYQLIDDWRQADVILYNTCSVRELAEQKVYSRIGEVGQHKQQRPDLVLGVLGCMAEREGSQIGKRYPQIDLICGPGELDKVPMLIDNAVKTRIGGQGGKRRSLQQALQGNTHRRTATLAAAEDQLEMLDLARSFQPDTVEKSAYVRITRGCNKFCTYCVVPNTRGREVHRPPQHIIDECKRLVDAGVIEITLLGQTVNHYHYDHGAAVTLNGILQPQVGAVVRNQGNHSQSWRTGQFKGPVTTFADLLRQIHDQVPDLQRLRFVTSFPRDFGDDVLEAIRDCPRICRYLHLPVQSGSDRILKLMNRGYTVAEYRDLLDRARAILPDCTIATDIICGFPTETEQDHQATAELLAYGQFKNSFIFKYSPRPGTAAIQRLKDDVPEDVKKRRNNELLAIQSRVSQAVHQAYVGRTVRVYVESISRKELKARDAGMGQSVYLGWDKPTAQLCGRTDGDLIVLFEGDESLVGQLADIRVQRAAPLTLFGQLADSAVSHTLPVIG